MARRLATLIEDGLGDDAVIVGSADDVEVTGIELDSREARPGDLFCCVRGEHVDGHQFAATAVARGAAALLVDRRLDTTAVGVVPQVVVADTRRAMGLLAAAYHDHPSRRLTLVGVTGTNGKTTTTALIAAVLEHAGLPTGTIGTLSGAHTTPESPELQRRLAGHLADGRQAVVMEVSSHALALGRVIGCHFDLGVFTNLGHDHLDLHGTVEAYFAAKAALFDGDLTDRAVINADDEHGRRLIASTTIPVTPFSVAELADVQVSVTDHSYLWRGEHVRMGIGGPFNVANSLAAATACAELGVAPELVAAGLSAAPTVPGRFEPVDAGQSFSVIVDFAHTPEGLRAALRAARPSSCSGRLIAVFGCGGDRDTGKRPQMGAVAAEHCDILVLTSDNPRSEDPSSIIDAIRAGVPEDYRGALVLEPDRRLAIAAAVEAARPGDVVVIAGKGHEATQTIAGRTVAFDDRAVARQLLEAQR